jgi:hypothetical protein
MRHSVQHWTAEDCAGTVSLPVVRQSDLDALHMLPADKAGKPDLVVPAWVLKPAPGEKKSANAKARGLKTWRQH